VSDHIYVDEPMGDAEPEDRMYVDEPMMGAERTANPEYYDPIQDVGVMLVCSIGH
jgi:hypothetical protein